jgi:hypothetical protein
MPQGSLSADLSNDFGRSSLNTAVHIPLQPGPLIVHPHALYKTMLLIAFTVQLGQEL